MKYLRWFALSSFAALLLIAAPARAGGLGPRPGPPVYVYSAEDDVVVRRPSVSFLEAIAFILAAVGCFFGVAAFVEAKTAHRLIEEIKAKKTIRDFEP
jgi:hypothetical protein